jgi:hypothetical protein
VIRTPNALLRRQRLRCAARPFHQTVTESGAMAVLRRVIQGERPLRLATLIPAARCMCHRRRDRPVRSTIIRAINAGTGR